MAMESDLQQTISPPGEANTSPLTNPGVISVVHNEQYRLEQELEERVRQLEGIFEAMTDGLIVYDREGRVLQTNTAAERLLAMNNQNISYYQRSVRERAPFYTVRDEHGQLLTAEQGPVMRVLKGEKLTSENAMDIQVSTPDGREIQLSVNCSPLHDQTGQLVGAVCIYHDVTERRRLEKRTQAALAGMVAIAEAIVLPATDNRPSGDLSTTGGKTHPLTKTIGQRLVELICGILGCARAGLALIETGTEVLHPLAITGVTPEIEQGWHESMEGITLTERLGGDLHVARMYAGESTIIDLTQPPYNARPSHGAHTLLIVPMQIEGQLIGLISLGFSCADHVYTAEEITLAKAVARLSALILERERLIQERAEAQANELALRVANQRMDEFLSMASHELRTPLTTIKASIQLARRRVASSLQEIVSENDTQRGKLVEMQAILDRAERQVNMQNRLIDDLLEVSRIQAHKLTLHLKECDLATIVREAVEDQQATMPHHTIQLELSVTEPVMLSVDADRIQQVLTNYLTNACKYSPADHPIVVRLQVKGEYMCVCVHDEGPGLPPEEQAQIWERFYRVQGIEAKNGSTVGLGLGLPICRAIIEQHQGQVGVESTPGIGSTFWFALPLTGK